MRVEDENETQISEIIRLQMVFFGKAAMVRKPGYHFGHSLTHVAFNV